MNKDTEEFYIPEIEELISKSKTLIKNNTEPKIRKSNKDFGDEFHIINVDKYINLDTTIFIEKWINKEKNNIYSNEYNDFDVENWSSELIDCFFISKESLNFIIYKEIVINTSTTYEYIYKLVEKLDENNEMSLVKVKKHYWEKHYLNKREKCYIKEY